MNYAEFNDRWVFQKSFFGDSIKEYGLGNFKHLLGACYFIVDDHGCLAYVGKSSTTGLCSRIRSHEEKRWFAKAYVIETGEKSAFTSADVIEKALIRCFQPYANRQRYTGAGDVGTDVWILWKNGIKVPFDNDPKTNARLVDYRFSACPMPMLGEPKGAYHERLMVDLHKNSAGAIS